MTEAALGRQSLGFVTTHWHQQEHQSYTFKCVYAHHSYVGTTFSHAEKHPPSRNGDKPSEDSLSLHMWQGDKKTHTVLSPYGMHPATHNCIYPVIS